MGCQSLGRGSVLLGPVAFVAGRDPAVSRPAKRRQLCGNHACARYARRSVCIADADRPRSRARSDLASLRRFVCRLPGRVSAVRVMSACYAWSRSRVCCKRRHTSPGNHFARKLRDGMRVVEKRFVTKRSRRRQGLLQASPRSRLRSPTRDGFWRAVRPRSVPCEQPRECATRGALASFRETCGLFLS